MIITYFGIILFPLVERIANLSVVFRLIVSSPIRGG